MKEKIDMGKGIRIEVLFGCAFALALIAMLLAFSFYDKRSVRVDAKPSDTIVVASLEKSDVVSTSSVPVATQENFVTNEVASIENTNNSTVTNNNLVLDFKGFKLGFK